MLLETDFQVLSLTNPRLRDHISRRPAGQALNWRDPEALRALSSAMLAVNFGVLEWDVPPDRICPPIPVRFEYLSWVNTLLRGSNADSTAIRLVDIGTGASCVYPLIGAKAFGYVFLLFLQRIEDYVNVID